MQLAYQLALGIAGFAYSLIVSFILLWTINRVPGQFLKLKWEENAQSRGIDALEIGEVPYTQIQQERGNGVQMAVAA
jgi:ammonium transporter, Amt family